MGGNSDDEGASDSDDSTSSLPANLQPLPLPPRAQQGAELPRCGDLRLGVLDLPLGPGDSAAPEPLLPASAAESGGGAEGPVRLAGRAVYLRAVGTGGGGARGGERGS